MTLSTPVFIEVKYLLDQIALGVILVPDKNLDYSGLAENKLACIVDLYCHLGVKLSLYSVQSLRSLLVILCLFLKINCSARNYQSTTCLDSTFTHTHTHTHPHTQRKRVMLPDCITFWFIINSGIKLLNNHFNEYFRG